MNTTTQKNSIPGLLDYLKNQIDTGTNEQKEKINNTIEMIANYLNNN